MNFTVTTTVVGELLGALAASGALIRWANTPHRKAHSKMEYQIEAALVRVDAVYLAMIPPTKREIEPLKVKE